MIFDLSSSIETMRLNTQGRATSLLTNSDEKTHYCLGFSISEVRDVEYKRDWNRAAGYVTTLNEAISAVIKLRAGRVTDESKRIGS
jgi:hypothetical protein